MKLLVYCILGERPPGSELPMGVEGCAVSLVADGGLAAAVSSAPETCATPSVPRVVEYARVVEALHEAATVLPMRYGCLAESEAEIVELLRTRRAQFLARLDELDGCAEMGLRILLAGPGPPLPQDLRNAAKAVSGRAYLQRLRACYDGRERDRAQADALIEMAKQAFAGLFRKCDAEHSVEGRLLSLHFLTHRDKTEAFRASFRGLQEARTEKMLLTGPWPPYNFVGDLNLGTRD